MIDTIAVQKKYLDLYNTPSDINTLLPYLKQYAEKCGHITEMGVREPTSTYAFLAGNPEKLVSYDIHRTAGIADVEKLAPGTFNFILEDVLAADIEETDFLFLDTYHTATQLAKELEKHADKVRKYIGFHDTGSFWDVGEEAYPGIAPEIACGRGLKHAIVPFLRKGGWYISFMTDNNSGLLILERKIKGQRSTTPLFARLKYTLYLRSKQLRKTIFNIRQKWAG